MRSGFLYLLSFFANLFSKSVENQRKRRINLQGNIRNAPAGKVDFVLALTCNKTVIFL